MRILSFHFSYLINDVLPNTAEPLSLHFSFLPLLHSSSAAFPTW